MTPLGVSSLLQPTRGSCGLLRERLRTVLGDSSGLEMALLCFTRRNLELLRCPLQRNKS